MTDQPAAAPGGLPPLARQIVTALLQKALTAAATGLTTYGVIAPNQGAAFTSLALSAGLWCASLVWTWLHEHAGRARLAAAINAPPPAVPVRP